MQAAYCWCWALRWLLRVLQHRTMVRMQVQRRLLLRQLLACC
jgi:hypothetical protein